MNVIIVPFLVGPLCWLNDLINGGSTCLLGVLSVGCFWDILRWLSVPAPGWEVLTGSIRPPELGWPLHLMFFFFFLSIGFSEADTPLTLLAQSHYVLLMKLWGSWSSSGVCEGRVLTGVAVLADSLKFGEEEAPYKSPESLLLSRLSSKVLLGS